MKKFILTLFVILPFIALSQGLYNNGASIVITSGGYLYIDGGANGNFTNAAGEVDIDGYMIVEGNFTNNAANNVFTNVDTDGEVRFAGGTQTITSALPNYTNFEKVTINSGSSTTLIAGSGMTVNGTFDVDGTFTSATPTDETIGGSLITATGAGAITGTGTININRFFKVNGRWQYISVPMTNQQSDLFTEHTTSGNFNPNFYSYNEAFDQNLSADPNNTNYSNYTNYTTYNFWQAWEQVQATMGAPVVLNPAVGYICYNEGNLNTVFTTGAGNPDYLNNDVSYSPAVSYTSNDNGGGYGSFYDGWNLIGNPYQSALDWANADWTRTNISNTVYMWDGDNGNYVYYWTSSDDHLIGDGQTLNYDATGEYIPAMQSFMVKATAASPTLTIPASARTHNNNEMYKNVTEKPQYDYIKLELEVNGQKDQTLVRFYEDATEEIEDEFDAYKAYATTAGLPQLYSICYNQIPLAINTLPIDEYVEYKRVPLGIVAKQSGKYTFKAADFETKYFDKIYLIDQSEQNIISTDLTLTPDYSVYLEEGENRDRFSLLCVNSFTDIEDIFNNNSSVNIYSNDNIVYISISNIDDINGNVEIYDALGKIILKDNANSNFNEYVLNVASGAYFVRYFANSNTYIQKIIIK